MRNFIIILIILTVGGVIFYNDYYAQKGAFDENGNPFTIVFTINAAKDFTPKMFSILKKRKIAFEEVNIDLGAEQKKRFKRFGGGKKTPTPMTVIGHKYIYGFNEGVFISSLIEVYGEKAMNWGEKKAMKKNFDADGNPLVVLYSTPWCGYCKEIKKYLKKKGVEFKEYDIERDSTAALHHKILKGSGVPLIYVGYSRVDGYDLEKLDQALKQL